MAKPKCYQFHLFAKFEMSLFLTVQDWNRAMAMNNIDESIDDKQLGRSWICTSSGIKLAMYIQTENFKYGNVIHESVHIVDFLMEEIGINDIEFRAYMIEDLAVRVIEKIRILIDCQKIKEEAIK